MILRSLWYVVQGAFIGVGAMLPGISGGVLCVVFGIYRPVMEFLSHPLRAFKKSYPLLLPVLVGWVAGFWVSSKLLHRFFESAAHYATFLFIGLIVGTLPSLFKTAGEQGRKRADYFTAAGFFALFLFIMLFFSGSDAVVMEPNLLWWLLCGALWGLSLIVPGLSSSAFLLYIGLYQKMTEGIAAFDLQVIAPMLLGIILVVVLLTRVVNLLFEKAHSLIYHALFGIVAASAVAIVPHGQDADYSLSTIPIYALCFAGGLAVALWMERFGKSAKGGGDGSGNGVASCRMKSPRSRG